MAGGGMPGLGCPALSPRARGPIRGVGAGAQACRDPTSSSRHQGQEPPQPQCLTAPFSLGRLLHSFTPQPPAWPSPGLPTPAPPQSLIQESAGGGHSIQKVDPAG